MEYEEITKLYHKRLKQIKDVVDKSEKPIPYSMMRATLSAWSKIEDYSKPKPRAVKEASEKYGCSQTGINELLSKVKVRYVAQEKYREHIKEQLQEHYALNEQFKDKLHEEEETQMNNDDLVKVIRQKRKENKTTRININVTKADKVEFEKRATERGMTVTDFILTCCLDNTQSEPTKAEIRESDNYKTIQELAERIKLLEFDVKRIDRNNGTLSTAFVNLMNDTHR